MNNIQPWTGGYTRLSKRPDGNALYQRIKTARLEVNVPGGDPEKRKAAIEFLDCFRKISGRLYINEEAYREWIERRAERIY